MKGDKCGFVYFFNFMFDGVESCVIVDNFLVYICIWCYVMLADMGCVYQCLVNDVKVCVLLVKELLGIIVDELQECCQGDLCQIIEVIGLDYVDVEVMILIGQM